jgi:FlaG/FlaF family flagellin (archaellin)
MRRMSRLSALVTAGVMVASLFAAAGTASAAPGDATLWVVHGVPGATVEVCVNGLPAKDDFAYRQKFSTLLPAGDHTFALYANGANCTGSPIAADFTRTLAMDGNYTLVADVSNQTGKVRFHWFSNNVANTNRGMFRLSIRHVAVAPAVNVFMNKTRMTVPALTQGASKTVQLAWGDYVTRVKVAGTSNTILGPGTRSFESRTAVQLYLVGNSTVGYKFLRIDQDVVKAV